MVIFSRPNPAGEKREFQSETSGVFYLTLIQINPNNQIDLITFQFFDPPYSPRAPQNIHLLGIEFPFS